MKNLVLLAGLLFATISQAATQTLYCNGGSFASFTATLLSDPSGPGYFDLKNSKISKGGFREANLICAGNTLLENVKCAGFWNNLGTEHVEISFANARGQLLLSYKPVSGTTAMTEPAWLCTIE